jgi:hypothetical protein
LMRTLWSLMFRCDALPSSVHIVTMAVRYSAETFTLHLH